MSGRNAPLCFTAQYAAAIAPYDYEPIAATIAFTIGFI